MTTSDVLLGLPCSRQFLSVAVWYCFFTSLGDCDPKNACYKDFRGESLAKEFK